MNDTPTPSNQRQTGVRDRYRDDVASTAERNFDDTRLDAFRTAGRRRWLILVWGATVVAIGGVIMLDDPFITLGSFVVGGGMTWLLRRVVRTVPDMPDYVLDERLIQRRDHSYRLAYQVVVTAVLLLLLGLYIAADATRIAYDVQPTHLNAAFMVLLFGSLGLPSAIYGWLEEEV